MTIGETRFLIYLLFIHFQEVLEVRVYIEVLGRSVLFVILARVSVSAVSPN
jgi:hypothetical protein